MTLAIGSLALRRLALGATLFGLAACPADDSEEDGTATDDPTVTPTTTTPTTSTTATTDPSDTTGDTATDVDYATDIQPIWDANCISGCHEPDGITGAVAVDLTAGASHNSLTTIKPVYSTEDNFVVPGSAEDSFLIDALRHPPGTIVRQMPLLLDESVDPAVGIEGTPLPEGTIVMIEAWIDAGANP